MLFSHHDSIEWSHWDNARAAFNFGGKTITAMRMHVGRVLKNQVSNRTLDQLKDILQNNRNLVEVPSVLFLYIWVGPFTTDLSSK